MFFLYIVGRKMYVALVVWKTSANLETVGHPLKMNETCSAFSDYNKFFFSSKIEPYYLCSRALTSLEQESGLNRTI